MGRGRDLRQHHDGSHRAGLNPSAAAADLSAAIVLAVAAVLGAVFAWRLGARYTVAIATAWGLAWIAVGRIGVEPASAATAIAAIAAALVVILAVPWARARSTRRSRAAA